LNDNIEICKKSSVDQRIIKLGGENMCTIFDTGASGNMIISGALSIIKSVKVKPNKKEYSFFDSSKSNSIERQNWNSNIMTLSVKKMQRCQKQARK
jgi:hypothetical protein